MHPPVLFRPAAFNRPLTLSLGLLAATLVSSAWADDYPHAQEPIGTVEQIYDGAMLPDLAVSTYRNIGRLFPTHTIKAGDHPYALPKSDRQLPNVRFTVEGKKYD
ncbi:MAG: serine hydrolase, partial [Pseudomonas graminis]